MKNPLNISALAPKMRVRIALIIGGAVVLAALTVLANISRLRSPVHDVVVDIRHRGTPLLVSQQTVRDSIFAAMPQLSTTRVADVDRDRVANAVLNVPFIESATASVSVSGKVVVKAVQRRPIARLYYGNREFYFDKYGKVFPTSTLASCDVLVAGGNFKQPLRRDSLSAQVLELVEVARFLDENSKYSPMVDQIYSQAEGSVCLAPKLGNFTIELGDAQNLEEKFSNLLSFYCNGLPRAGWNTYSRISLKFNGQVVCTRAKNVRQ